MSIGVEIARPSIANQARGMRELQPLRQRIAYLAHKETRAYALLQDLKGNELSQEAAYEYLGGGEKYLEVVHSLSETDWQALIERSPEKSHEEVARDFGQVLACHHGEGRPVLTAIHFDEISARPHYHLNTTDPFVDIDRHGKQKTREMEGIGQHLDNTFQAAWKETLPHRRGPRGKELEALKSAQERSYEQQKAIAAERKALKKVMDAEVSPYSAMSKVFKADKQYRDQIEVDSKVADIRASYGERFKDLWRRERDAELESHILWLERKGFGRGTIEAACARERADIRLTTRLNRVERDFDRAVSLRLQAEQKRTTKEMSTDEKKTIRESEYRREVELIKLRFDERFRSLSARENIYTPTVFETETTALLLHEVDARTAAKLRFDAVGLRDKQSDLESNQSIKGQKEAIKAEQTMNLKDVAKRSEELPEEQREKFIRTEKRRINKAAHEKRTALTREAWPERVRAHAEARNLLETRHELEREAFRLDAKADDRRPTEKQGEALTKRHEKDTAWCESAWITAQAGQLMANEKDLFDRAVGTLELDDLRTEKEALLERIKEHALSLPEEQGKPWLRAETRNVRREAEQIEREIQASLNTDKLEEAVEQRISMQREAERLRAFAQGREFDPEAFDREADRSILYRAEARNKMRGLRYEEADQKNLAQDRAYSDERWGQRDAETLATKQASDMAAATVKNRLEAALQEFSTLPTITERINRLLAREPEASARRERHVRRQAQLDAEREHLQASSVSRHAALDRALEKQTERQACAIEIAKIEKARNKQEWTPEDETKLEAEHEKEAKRLYAVWFEIEGQNLAMNYQCALNDAKGTAKVDLIQDKLSVEREALYREFGLKFAALASAKASSKELLEQQLERELRTAEARLEARAAREASAVRAETNTGWGALREMLGQKQGYELQAAADGTWKDDDYERMQKIRDRHDHEVSMLAEAELRSTASKHRDRILVLLEPFREAKRSREDRALERERAAMTHFQEAKRESALHEAREASRKEEYEALRDSRPNRISAFGEAMIALISAQTIEKDLLAKAEPREGQKSIHEQLVDMDARHEIQRKALDIEQLRDDERLGRGGIEFGKFSELSGAYRLASESMEKRHGLEKISLERKLDLAGVATDAPERAEARSALAEKHQSQRDGLQKVVNRVRGNTRSLRVPGKGLALTALRESLSKLREAHDKAGKSRHDNADTNRIGSGFSGAAITTVQTAGKVSVEAVVASTRQAAKQVQHAVRAGVHAARSAAVTVVNPMAGLRAASAGLGDIGKKSLKDLGKGTKDLAKTTGKDLFGGGKTASKQVMGGLVDLSVPGGAEGKAVVAVAKEMVMAAKRTALEAVAAVRSAVTLDALGVMKSALGMGTSVVQGGIGVAKEAGVGIAKSLPAPIDKALAALSSLPVLGLPAKLLQVGGQVAHGAVQGLDLER